MAHIDAGKTTTTERILFYTGITYKIGEVHEGTAVMDWMEQEQERGITITSAATTCFWRDIRINIIDTPGPRRLHRRGRALAARARRRRRRVRRGVRRRAAVRDGLAPGRQVPRAAHLLRQQDGPHRRRLQADARADRDASCRRNPVAIQLPIGAEDKFAGVIDLVRMKAIRYKDETMGADYVVEEIPADMHGRGEGVPREADREGQRGRRQAAREVPGAARRSPRTRSRRRCASATIESVRDEKAPFVAGHLRLGVQEQGRAAAARRGRGLPAVAARHARRSPASTRRKAEETLIERPADDEAPFSALAFKIMTDPFVGQLTFIRVYSGVMTSGSSVYNATKGKTERVGRLLKMHANKREEIKEVYAGDIAAAVGLKSVTHGRHDLRREEAGRARVDGLPRAGHLAGHRAEDQGRPGEAGRGPGEADGRGPDLPREDRHRDRPGRHRAAWASCTSRSSSTA